MIKNVMCGMLSDYWIMGGGGGKGPMEMHHDFPQKSEMQVKSGETGGARVSIHQTTKIQPNFIYFVV